MIDVVMNGGQIIIQEISQGMIIGGEIIPGAEKIMRTEEKIILIGEIIRGMSTHNLHALCVTGKDTELWTVQNFPN